MFFVFASFVLNGNPVVKEFGIGLAAAIAIDVTLVRFILVPAVMVLGGERMWWLPGWLDRVLPRFSVEVDLGAGERLGLEERFLATASLTTTGPASVRRATVDLEGKSQSVSDYWRLVYTARRHNTDVRYWVVLDPALELPSVSEPVHALEIVAPQEPLTEGDQRVRKCRKLLK